MPFQPFIHLGVDLAIHEDDVFEMEYIEHVLVVKVKSRTEGSSTKRYLITGDFTKADEVDFTTLPQSVQDAVILRLHGRGMTNIHIALFTGLSTDIAYWSLRNSSK
jgi:hypothetical protein